SKNTQDIREDFITAVYPTTTAIFAGLSTHRTFEEKHLYDVLPHRDSVLYASDIDRVRHPVRRSPNVSYIRRNDLRKTTQDERAERTPWHTITQTACSMSVARSRQSCHPGRLPPWGRRKDGGQVSTCRLATDDQWRNMSFSRLGDTYDERMPRLPEV
ncbi:hypothetical protein GT037_009317, partial [Alternaria burnsii]